MVLPLSGGSSDVPGLHAVASSDFGCAFVAGEAAGGGAPVLASASAASFFFASGLHATRRTRRPTSALARRIERNGRPAGVHPETVDVVGGTRVVLEDVHDDVAEVHEDPVRVRKPFDGERALAPL